MKRYASTFLILLLLLGVFAGCQKNEVLPAESSGTPDHTTQPSDDSAVDSLPQLDFEGADINLYTWTATDEWVLDVEDLSTLTAMDYASYQHLKNVENRLHVCFNIVATRPGGWGQHEDFIAAVERTAGDGSIDLVCQYSLASIYGAQRGIYKNLNELNYFCGWEGKYWNDNLIDSNTIHDKIYYVTGDMTPTTITRIGTVVFNRSLVNEYFDSDTLYDTVDSGEWTFDTLLTMTRDIYIDLNQNSSRDVGDRFGFVIPANNLIDLLQYGADLPCIITDADGTMILNPEFTEYGEKAIELTELVRDICWNIDGTFLGYTPLSLQGNEAEKGNDKYTYRDAMKNGNAAFQLVWTREIISDIRPSGVDYGILPIPKYDAQQADYHTALEMTYSMFSIPADCKNPEMVAAVMEAMGSDGYTYLVPEIFEKQLKYQYVKTSDDSRMFELLRNGIIYEPGRIFSYIDCFSLFRRACTYDKEWTSWYLEQAGTAYQERLDNIMFEFQ